MTTARTLRLALRPSYRLAALLVAVHCAAAGALYAVLPTAAGMLVAALVAALGATAAWDRALLRGRRAPRALEVSPAALAVELADGTRRLAAPGARNYVGAWGVRVRLEGLPRRSVMIAGDMLPEPMFRILRVWALWGQLPESAADAASGRLG